MSRRRTEPPRLPKNEAWPCDELGPEDGIDPRILTRDRSRNRAGRKDHQLCKQVARALNLWLSERASSRWAAEIFVQTVQPAPNAGRLRVEIGFLRPVELDLAEQVLAEMGRQRAAMRWAVGQAIVRKRVPELVFALGQEQERGGGAP